MPQPAVDLKAKLELIAERWSPRIVARLNDYHFKLAKLEGEFVWHAHADTDEAFLVLQGSLAIELRGPGRPGGLERVELAAGELYVVPRGVEHKPVAARECHVLLIEPAGTRNTGDAGGKLTAPDDVWV